MPGRYLYDWVFDTCFGFEDLTTPTDSKLLKVTDILEKETKQTNQSPFYIYNNGTLEKKIIIE